MRFFICSAVLGVVLAGSFIGTESTSLIEKSVRDRQAAIEAAIDGESKSERQ